MSGIRGAIAIAAVVAAALAAGCGDGDGDAEPAATEAQAGCAAQPQGESVAAVYTAEAAGSGTADEQALDATASLLCERATALGVEGAQVQAAGGRITVRLPDSPDAKDALAQITAPHELAFYDWEANLVAGDPQDPPAGTLVVEQTGQTVTGSPEQTGAKRFLLRDRPALTGEDIASAEQEIDSVSGQPVVAFDFTAAGEEAFEQMTRDVVERAAAKAPPGVSSQQALDYSDHFAIVLDGEVIALPVIDFAENPDGIDGSNGAQIAGGLSVDESRKLAEFLEIGPLPVELEAVKRRRG